MATLPLAERRNRKHAFLQELLRDNGSNCSPSSASSVAAHSPSDDRQTHASLDGQSDANKALLAQAQGQSSPSRGRLRHQSLIVSAKPPETLFRVGQYVVRKVTERGRRDSVGRNILADLTQLASTPAENAGETGRVVSIMPNGSIIVNFPSGTVTCKQKDLIKAQLADTTFGPGDSFGELALLYNMHLHCH